MTETEAHLAASLSRRFRLIRKLGAGGMGAVFLAEQIAVGNRPVALKVLNRKLLDDPDFLLRFQNEAASTGRIHHPNVVTIHESGQSEDGTPYIAMEFLEGESLRQALTRRGALPVPEVAEILQQAARGLNAAHKLGIIHRDLKPDNIFLMRGDDDETIVKVVDFGIAKLRESATATHTQTGMVLGTPAYMSFEQASGMRSDELDARSDVYSLGVVVYEMLTGRTPFHSDTPVGYLRMHMQENPPPFRAVKPDLPALPQLESVVMKALSKDRDQRYASALHFARALASAAQPSPRGQAPLTIRSTPIAPPPARRRAARKPVAPVPPPATVKAKADNAVQAPPPAPPGKTVDPPSAQPQATKPVPATKPPELRTAPESPNKMKFVAIAGVALIIGLSAGIWYFLKPAEKKSNPNRSEKANISWSGKARKFKVEAKINPKDGLKYVWIAPGTFMMGCSPRDSCTDAEKPPHEVTITKGFSLGQTDVPVGAYKRFAAAAGRQMPHAPTENSGWANDSMPIVNVNWNDAHKYCAWAGGRLPTEAEWEYAARAGSVEPRYGPLDEIAWSDLNSSGDRTHPVGQKRANGFGLYDMLGNVWQWVNDWYDDKYYQDGPSQDPTGPRSGTLRVLRGGSSVLVYGFVRVSYRGVQAEGDVPDGFRCAREVAGP